MSTDEPDPRHVTIASAARDVITVEGPDALSYLQGQLSQDLAAIEVGASAHTLVLAPQGKVDGWGRVQRAGADRLVIDTDPGAGPAWDSRLRRFLLRTDATIDVAVGVPTIEVRGAAIDGGLEVAGPATVGRDFVGWEDPGPPPGVPEGAVVVDRAEAERLRIVAGVPRWGAELDGDTIPATLGQWLIDASVSFTKGCYTGQELVARIDSRGGNVPRHLRGLVVDGPPPEPGAEVLVEGRAVGTVTSSAADGGSSVALAFVARSVGVDDGPVPAEVAGVSAQVQALPLPS